MADKSCLLHVFEPVCLAGHFFYDHFWSAQAKEALYTLKEVSSVFSH